MLPTWLGLPRCCTDKESTCLCRRCKSCGFCLSVGNIPWNRKWQPTPVFLLGKFHGQRSLVGYHPWGGKIRHDWACTPRLSHLLGSAKLQQGPRLRETPRNGSEPCPRHTRWGISAPCSRGPSLAGVQPCHSWVPRGTREIRIVWQGPHPATHPPCLGVPWRLLCPCQLLPSHCGWRPVLKGSQPPAPTWSEQGQRVTKSSLPGSVKHLTCPQKHSPQCFPEPSLLPFEALWIQISSPPLSLWVFFLGGAIINECLPFGMSLNHLID